MAFSLFKSNKSKELEKKFTNFSDQLAQAFGQIRTDMESINQRLDSSQSEAERLSQWIGYLNRHAQRLSESNSKILEKFEKIAENHHNLHTSHHQLAASHAEMVEKAKNIENSHERLSGAISARQEGLKSEIRDELHSHIRQHREASEEDIRRLKAWIDYFSTHMDRQKGKEDALKQDISRIEQGWAESYSKLRELVNGIRGENGELKSNVSDVRAELDRARNELNSTILELETTKSELSAAKDAIKNTASELESTRNLAESLKDMPKSEGLSLNQPVQPLLQPQIAPPQQVIQQVSPVQSSFQRHIISRVMPNRKGYVLKFILDMIRENQHSTKEIEEIVVNEKQLCGRTSFYAYLKELKLKGRISYAEIDERQILVCTDSQTSLMDRIDRV